MAKFDIDYRFVRNAGGQLEMEIYIDNPDGDLKKGTMTPGAPKGHADPNLHHRTAFVMEDPTGSNPTTLVYTKTGIYPDGSNLKYLNIYCVESVEMAVKKKRRTGVTVSDGGGGGRD